MASALMTGLLRWLGAAPSPSPSPLPRVAPSPEGAASPAPSPGDGGAGRATADVPSVARPERADEEDHRGDDAAGALLRLAAVPGTTAEADSSESPPRLLPTAPSPPPLGTPAASVPVPVGRAVGAEEGSEPAEAAADMAVPEPAPPPVTQEAASSPPRAAQRRPLLLSAAGDGGLTPAAAWDTPGDGAGFLTTVAARVGGTVASGTAATGGGGGGATTVGTGGASALVASVAPWMRADGGVASLATGFATLATAAGLLPRPYQPQASLAGEIARQRALRAGCAIDSARRVVSLLPPPCPTPAHPPAALAPTAPLPPAAPPALAARVRDPAPLPPAAPPTNVALPPSVWETVAPTPQVPRVPPPAPPPTPATTPFVTPVGSPARVVVLRATPLPSPHLTPMLTLVGAPKHTPPPLPLPPAQLPVTTPEVVRLPALPLLLAPEAPAAARLGAPVDGPALLPPRARVPMPPPPALTKTPQAPAPVAGTKRHREETSESGRPPTPVRARTPSPAPAPRIAGSWCTCGDGGATHAPLAVEEYAVTVVCEDGTVVEAVALRAATGGSHPEAAAPAADGVNGELLQPSDDHGTAPRLWWPWTAADATGHVRSRIAERHLRAAAVRLAAAHAHTLSAAIAEATRDAPLADAPAEDTPYFTSGSEVVAALLLCLHGKAGAATWWAAAASLGIQRHFARVPVREVPAAPAAATTFDALLAAWGPALCIRSSAAWRAALAHMDAAWQTAVGGCAGAALAAARREAAAATLGLPPPPAAAVPACPLHGGSDPRPAFLARTPPPSWAGASRVTCPAGERPDTERAASPLSLLTLLHAFGAV